MTGALLWVPWAVGVACIVTSVSIVLAVTITTWRDGDLTRSARAARPPLAHGTPPPRAGSDHRPPRTVAGGDSTEVLELIARRATRSRGRR